MTSSNLSSFLATYPRKSGTYPDLSKTNWIAFEHKKTTYPGASCVDGTMYIWRSIFLFNCENSCLSTGMTGSVIELQRTHPVSTINEVSRSALPKTLRDSRHLKKRLVPPTLFHPSLHYGPFWSPRIIQIMCKLFWSYLPPQLDIIALALCDILGRSLFLTKRQLKRPPYLYSPLYPLKGTQP